MIYMKNLIDPFQGKGDMDGIYNLKMDVGIKPDANCIDGCIYYKNNNLKEEYCFAPVSNVEDSATLFCQVYKHRLEIKSLAHWMSAL